MYCKDCDNREHDESDDRYFCFSAKITESSIYGSTESNNGDSLIYSYNEEGWFYVQDNFGCVHFKSKEPKQGD